MASQKFLVDLDLQGQKIKDFVLGTTVGTENGAIWFDAATGLVKVIDSSGVTQSLSPKSYVDAEVAGEAADRADEITRVEGLITDEASARALAVSGLAADLADEVTARQSAISNLEGDLNTEATERAAADLNLASDISDETAARIAADGSLQNAIDAVAADLAALDADFATDAEVAAAIAVETARAEAAEAALSSDVSDVASDVEAVASDLATEITNRQNAVSAVASDLAGEVTAREAAVLDLAGDLADEVTAREAAVAAVANDLADEVGRATAAEGLIASDLADEVTARQNAVSGVASDLADEATARQNADNALDARIEDLEDAAPTYALSATVALDLASEATRADAYADAAALAAENAAKAHADQIAQGLNVKEAVRTVVMQATGLTQALSGTYTAFSKVAYDFENEEIVFDENDLGVALAVGDHVIVTDWEGSTPGGIYTVQSGAWTLREDWDNDTTKTGSFVFVSEGWFGGTSWASYEITTGPEAPYQNFTQMTGMPQLYPADSSIALEADGYGISVNTDYLVAEAGFARKATGLIALDSGTSHTISHSLGQDVVVSIRKISTGELVLASVVCNSGSVSVTLNESNEDSALKVVIIG